MLNHRLQVLIDEERLRRLTAESARRDVPVSVLVRDAIDAVYPVDVETRSAAAKAILGAPPMEVPDPDALHAELDSLRGRRG